MATLGAYALAALAALLAVLDMRRRHATERARQASLVAAWPELEPPKSEPMRTPQFIDEDLTPVDHRLRLRIVNRSNLPVTNVVVITQTMDRAMTPAEAKFQPDESDAVIEEENGVSAWMYRRPVLAPGAEWLVTLGYTTQHSMWLNLPQATLLFRDAAGAMWSRGPRGALDRADRHEWRERLTQLLRR